ncbi:hypothetical protein B0H13DRAFT_2270131 [Mycena leptocephala]|nr:hypothetical protein B0H13DRAFT_2270131 [Mycena leptocephala]
MEDPGRRAMRTAATSARTRGRRLGEPPPIDGPDGAPPPSSSSNSDSSSPDDTDTASTRLPALLSSQPATLPAARARYTLKTSRRLQKGSTRSSPSHGWVCWGVARFCAVFEGGKRCCCTKGERGEERREAGGLERGRGWFRERVEAVEKRLASDSNTHGIATLAIRNGRAHKPEHQAT